MDEGGSSPEGLGKYLLQFRQSRYFRPFYVAVLGLVVTGLFALTGGSEVTFCLGALAIPAAALVIPYWLGERSLKNFAINALPIFLIALLIIAAFQTNAMLSQGTPALTSGYDPKSPNTALPRYTFWNGTVEPFQGGADHNYTFRVRLKAVNTTSGAVIQPASVTVWTNISQYDVFVTGTLISVPMRVDASRTNTSNGTWYIAEKSLPASIYGFWFWANDSNPNNSMASNFVLAPLNSPASTYYAFWVVFTTFNLIFPVSFYFIIVFMYWYTVRMRKMRERMSDRAKGEKLDLEKGSPKGATAKEAEGPAPPRDASTKMTKKKAAAFTCTNCGADVTEDDAKCPKCGAVFED